MRILNHLVFLLHHYRESKLNDLKRNKNRVIRVFLKYRRAFNMSIPDYLDRDSLLRFSVTHVKNLLHGDECSIFLKDKKSNKYVLRDSTVLSEYIGLEFIGMEEKASQQETDGSNSGLTYTVLSTKKGLNIGDVRKDERWYGYKKHTGEIVNVHFELPFDEIHSYIAEPIIVEDVCLGVIRVVNKKINAFSLEDEKEFRSFVDIFSERISNAISFSELITTGATLSIEDLCQKIVEDILKITKSKACTIFFLDENSSSQETKVFRAIASTGLKDREGRQYNRMSRNIKEVRYNIDISSQTSNNLTEYAIKTKKLIVISDVYSDDELSHFNDLNRKKGPGKYSELDRATTGAILLSPIFNRDKNQVIGLIRLNKFRVIKKVKDKETNVNIFTKYEIRLFQLYVESLTQILINITFFETLDKIHSFSNKDDLYQYVVRAATTIVGGRGCSILILDNISCLLKFAASYGRLYDKIGELQPYKFGQGFTGWVAKNKKPLMYNDIHELRGKNDVEIPINSGRFEECETGRKTFDKFLAVPILKNNDDLIGVIRVPKIYSDSDFLEIDLRMLQSLTKHMALAFENIDSFEQHLEIKKVANIYEIGDLLQDQENLNRFFHIFLTGLTHGDVIGFNRAIVFKFLPSIRQLEGFMAVGPLNKNEGKAIRKKMEEKHAYLTIDQCINRFDDKSYITDDIHDETKNINIELPDNDELLNEILKYEKILKILKEDETNDIFNNEINEFLGTIDVKKVCLIILPYFNKESFVILCDNIYTDAKIDEITKRLLNYYLNLTVRALQGFYHNEELRIVRESAWQDLSAMAAHKLGQMLPIIHNRVWEETERIDPDDTKYKFWNDTLNQIDSCLGVVSDLRVLSAGVRLDNIND